MISHLLAQFTDDLHHFGVSLVHTFPFRHRKPTPTDRPMRLSNRYRSLVALRGS
jgi:hypothetical protein